MKKNLLFTVATIISIVFYSCDKKYETNTCADNKYYVSFVANEEIICFENCYASLTSQSINDITKQNTLIISGIISSHENDITWLFPSIAIAFPGSSTGSFNNDDINGLEFYVIYENENGSFFYPSLVNDQSSEYFELNIIDYDLNRNYISGNFKGKFFSTTDTDSIVIDDGVFEGNLYHLMQ